MILRTEWITDVLDFLQRAESLRSEMNAAAEQVRQEAQKSLNQMLLQAKTRLLGTMMFLHESFPAAPEIERSPAEKQRLILLVSFLQGADYVEELIAEGQYIKACAVVRQDYEFLTRVLEPGSCMEGLKAA